jgi:hypothetical protein
MRTTIRLAAGRIAPLLVLSLSLTPALAAPKKAPKDPKKDKKEAKEEPPPVEKVVLPPPDLSKMAETVSVLDVDGKAPDLQVLREYTHLEASKLVGLPVETKGSIAELSFTIGCAEVDALCLGNAAALVGSRYLLYGTAKAEGDKLGVTYRLYDGKEGRELAAASGSLRDASDREAVGSLLGQLLSGAPALKKAPPPPVVVEKTPVYKRAWFWGAVGAVVLSGAAAVVPLPGAPGAACVKDGSCIDGGKVR